MNQYRVVATYAIPGEGIERLKSNGYEVVVAPLAKAHGAHALLCLLTDTVSAEVMDAIGPQLKVISNMAAGLDNIDAEAAAARNITVTNTPGVLTEAVAEHAVALLLTLARKVVAADAFVRAGKYKGWDPALFLGAELQGKVLGLVGHGRIGCRTAEILQKGFGMHVIYYDSNRDAQAEERCAISYVPLQELVSVADVVSLHVPLLPATSHLIAEKELRLMKPTALLINTSRGQVVDEHALVRVLEEKQIAGAALDVFENEPKLSLGLAKADNVVLTPHIASATNEAREAMADLAVQNIMRVLPT